MTPRSADAAASDAAPLAVVGDALLDIDLLGTVERVCPDAPVPVVEVGEERARPGGAALAAVLAARMGPRPVRLVTALGDDEWGRQLAELIVAAGVELIDVGQPGGTPRKIRIRAQNQSLLRLDHHDAPAAPLRPAHALAALSGTAAVLVADYGRTLTAAPEIRDALSVAAAAGPLVWDPHPRGAAPVPDARLVTPNRAEARHFSGSGGDDLAASILQANTLVGKWYAHGVAITLGPMGAVLVDRTGTPRIVPTTLVAGADPCGAGDCFSAAAALAFADGAVPSEAVEYAVARSSAFVAAGGAAGWLESELGDGAAGSNSLRTPTAGSVRTTDVRAGGGTIVAAGGCFDLLHPGHVGLLEQARQLGDHLVVLVNSDASVRRLKGAGRPVQPEHDRVAVLRSLSCVDDVVLFDEDTPEAALRALRPHVFVKGGDYTLADLPEAATLATWGGAAVVLPYLPGRSTTRLVQEASRHDHDIVLDR